MWLLLRKSASHVTCTPIIAFNQHIMPYHATVGVVGSNANGGLLHTCLGWLDLREKHLQIMYLYVFMYNYLEKYSEWKPKGSNQCHNRPSKVATRSAVCGSPDGRHACTASFWWSSLGWSAHSTRSILLASFLAARNCQTKWFDGYLMLSVHVPALGMYTLWKAGEKSTTQDKRIPRNSYV